MEGYLSGEKIFVKPHFAQSRLIASSDNNLL
ncbi:DUF5951 family protein [Trabulsiella odontotermitis]